MSEIFTVSCQVCGSYLAGYVVRASPDVYADIGASARRHATCGNGCGEQLKESNTNNDKGKNNG